MSKASKITVTLAAVITTGVITYVHYQQNEERRRLHDGVLRDVARQHNSKNQSIPAVDMIEYGIISDQNEEEEEQPQDSFYENSKPPLTPHDRRKLPK